MEKRFKATVPCILTRPIFEYLNYTFVYNKEKRLSHRRNALSIVGLTYLIGFAIFFLANTLGWVG
ncbi:hypothetical protein [Streptococcus pluranimalium]|uniref:hypothetical protein n=1 Tax=Streptococcus pluranimalium TaxID=82348 RepID=UPI003F6913CA